jgi:hypothetical protein
VATTCIEHPHEPAEGLCRQCGAAHCGDCLVYPFGPTKPPYCVPCAVQASGLRANAGKRLMVVPKENKRRLKEWRKARKRDLDAPPPDGVATWQRMDESEAEAEEDAAAAKAAAEREALRLPPPVVETPTPPPGVNLAPPGPADQDWRDEITAGAEGSPVLGFLDDDEPPTPMFEPMPVATDPVDLPAPGHDEFGMGTPGHFAPLDEPTPLAVPGADGYQPPAYQPTTPVEPVVYDPTSFEPDPTFDGPAFEPIPIREAPVFEPPAYQPTTEPEVPVYEPVVAHEPPAAPYEPVTTPFEPTPFEPAPPAEVPAAVFEPSVDPLASSFGAPPPTVDPADAPPLPPATSLADFGLGDGLAEPTPMSFADDPLPPPAAAPRPVAPPPAAPRPPELANAPIRPRTPTRIPAAKPEDDKSDAKAMLARIAALRADKE